MYSVFTCILKWDVYTALIPSEPAEKIKGSLYIHCVPFLEPITSHYKNTVVFLPGSAWYPPTQFF